MIYRNNIFQRPTLLLFALLIATLSATARADWPHWRGPTRNDISSESSGWNGERWLADGERWRINVGLGSSSPLVVGNSLYTVGWIDGKETLQCRQLDSGNLQWQQAYKAPQYGRHSTGDKSFYKGPSATPEFDAATGYLYSMGIDGDLRCWNTRVKGKPVWQRNLYADYHAERRPEVAVRRRTQRDYGYTTSPLVHEDWLLVEVGGKTGTLIAFDKATGKEVWVSECKDEAGHTGGPVPITVDGIPCVVLLTLRNLVVIRLDDNHTGKTLGQTPWTTDFANNIPTPAVRGNSIIVSTAYNQSAMTRLDASRDGLKQVWTSPRPTGVCSPVIHKNSVYWAWKGMHCVDFTTGKHVWTGGRCGTAASCLMTADDRWIVLANEGDLSLLETRERAPQKLTTLAQRKQLFKNDVWPHVVLTDGRILCKDRDGNLVCLDGFKGS